MKVLFYNVENLFDALDGPYVIENDFQYGSGLKWNQKRYIFKLRRIAKAIRAAGDDLPAAIGLAEVENRKVLEDLAAALGLSKDEAGIIHEESPDERGIDVGFIYNKDFFINTEHKACPVVFSHDPNDKTRDILHVKAELKNGEILHFFINHWPSRRYGAKLSLPKRFRAAEVLREQLDRVFTQEENPKIIVMGDFNTGPEGRPLTKLLDRDKSEGGLLHNLSRDAFNNNQGSIKYRGKWQMFDQILVSPALLNSKTACRVIPGSFEILKKDWMLFYNQKHHDYRPDKTYGGNKYYGGYSDHLPVYVTLVIDN